MKGYFTGIGYVGFLHNEKTRLFATESEYEEFYMEEEDDRRDQKDINKETSGY